MPAEARRRQLTLASLVGSRSWPSRRSLVLDRDDPPWIAWRSMATRSRPRWRADGETTTTEATTTTTRPPVAASTTVLRQTQRITGDISPKSVVASPHGLVFAQNMMYTHTVTAYRPDGALAATIDDGVDLADLRRRPGTRACRRALRSRRRSPATAATPTCRTTRCTAPASAPRATTRARPTSGYDDSYIYRIDTETFAIDQAIKVGAVPKYVAVTPDDTQGARHQLVHLRPQRHRRGQRPRGRTGSRSARYPRGIVVSPDSRTAYVAVMGGDVIVRVDLATQQVTNLVGSGDAPAPPAHLARTAASLYVSHNQLQHRRAHRRRHRRGDPLRLHRRAAAQHGDLRRRLGDLRRQLRVVDGHEAPRRRPQRRSTSSPPTTTRSASPTSRPRPRVWVACYGGSILVFDDSSPA